MRTAKALALAAALSLSAPIAADAGGWRGGYHGGGCGSGFWTGVGVIGGLIGLGIVADALTRPDVVYVSPPPAYYPPPTTSYHETSEDAEARERDAYLAGWTAGREQARDDEPYYPTARVRTNRR